MSSATTGAVDAVDASGMDGVVATAGAAGALVADVTAAVLPFDAASPFDPAPLAAAPLLVAEAEPACPAPKVSGAPPR